MSKVKPCAPCFSYTGESAVPCQTTDDTYSPTLAIHPHLHIRLPAFYAYRPANSRDIRFCNMIAIIYSIPFIIQWFNDTDVSLFMHVPLGTVRLHTQVTRCVYFSAWDAWKKRTQRQRYWQKLKEDRQRHERTKMLNTEIQRRRRARQKELRMLWNKN